MKGHTDVLTDGGWWTVNTRRAFKVVYANRSTGINVEEEEEGSTSEVYSKVKAADRRCGGTWDDEQLVYHTHRARQAAHDTCVPGLALNGGSRVASAKATVRSVSSRDG